jgi:hypothetical protein
VVKVGTKVKNIRLVEGDHDIDCKIDGIGAMKLKSEFVKKHSYGKAWPCRSGASRECGGSAATCVGDRGDAGFAPCGTPTERRGLVGAAQAANAAVLRRRVSAIVEMQASRLAALLRKGVALQERRKPRMRRCGGEVCRRSWRCGLRALRRSYSKAWPL